MSRWFTSVELVTAETIGIETATYVRNICQSCTAYALAVAIRAAQRKARETVKPSS